MTQTNPGGCGKPAPVPTQADRDANAAAYAEAFAAHEAARRAERERLA